MKQSDDRGAWLSHVCHSAHTSSNPTQTASGIPAKSIFTRTPDDRGRNSGALTKYYTTLTFDILTPKHAAHITLL